MQISYYYIDPTKNITLLVETPVEENLRAYIASELMKTEKDAEQVGFCTDTALYMAGGEFCGNATISAAALYCEKHGMDSFDGEMTVSGAGSPVKTSVIKQNGLYTGTVQMPPPEKITYTGCRIGGENRKIPVVVMPGISHMILDSGTDKKELEKAVPGICRSLGCDALGAMLINESRDELTPLVYVPGSGTLVWESSCASGTTAAGFYLSRESEEDCFMEFREPGGTLGIEIKKGFSPVLHGKAEIKYRKTADIPLP